jgi:hypothetical protein
MNAISCKKCGSTNAVKNGKVNSSTKLKGHFYWGKMLIDWGKMLIDNFLSCLLPLVSCV